MEEEGTMGQRSSIVAIHTASHTAATDAYYGYYGPTKVSGITVLPVYSTEAVIVGPPSLEDAHTGSTMIQSCRSLFEQGAGGGGGGA